MERCSQNPTALCKTRDSQYIGRRSYCGCSIARGKTVLHRPYSTTNNSRNLLKTVPHTILQCNCCFFCTTLSRHVGIYSLYHFQVVPGAIDSKTSESAEGSRACRSQFSRSVLDARSCVRHSRVWERTVKLTLNIFSTSDESCSFRSHSKFE